jgi:hypothetical protein
LAWALFEIANLQIDIRARDRVLPIGMGLAIGVEFTGGAADSPASQVGIVSHGSRVVIWLFPVL